MEIFQSTCLGQRERKILNMLLDGYTVDEIQRERRITGQELGALCRNIGSRWEAFNQAGSAA